MENGVVNGSKKGKRQGIEGSANANDVWVWMRPHIGFCAIGKYDLLSVFLLIESLLTACKFHALFFNMELFIWGFTSFAFQYLFPFFQGSFFLLGRDSTNWNFLGESLGK
jgi:hypothetical protein